MNTENIRKDWLYWIMAIGVATLAASITGFSIWAIFHFLLDAPESYSITIGGVCGLAVFASIMQMFGLRIDLGLS